MSVEAVLMSSMGFLALCPAATKSMFSPRAFWTVFVKATVSPRVALSQIFVFVSYPKSSYS